ncbi:MAG: FG-GAP-like repeat-containing protein [Xanthobacteraceae bacterium]
MTGKICGKTGGASLFARSLVVALTLMGSSALAEEILVPSKIVPLPAGQKITSFDISYVDSALGLYVLADRTNSAIDVVDIKSDTLLRQAGKGLFKGNTGNNDTSGPDGVLIVKNDAFGTGNEIWAGDGDSTMKVLDLATGTLQFSISTGGAHRVDEMCQDPVRKIVLAANNAEDPFPFVTFFDARTKTILKQIVFDGSNNTPIATNGIEQCQFDSRTQKFYITVPEVNGPGNNSVPGGVAVLDPDTQSVITTYLIPINTCSGPQGMAIGPAPQILLGCNGGPNQAQYGYPTAVIDDGSTGGIPGNVIKVYQFQSGADMVDYNAGTNHYTLARSNANPPQPNGVPSCTPNPTTAGPQVIGLLDAQNADKDPNLATGEFSCPNTSPARTRGGNHSIASDPATKKYYFPVASNSGSTLCGSVGGDNTLGCILVLVETVATFANTHDFNGDNNSDIAWRQTSTGNTAIWIMKSAQIYASGIVGVVPTNWNIVGQRDFDQDSYYDLLWQDTSGNVAIWFMNSYQIKSTASLGNVGPTWFVNGTDDFNGDGKGDILWRDSGGNVAMWLMNGSSLVSAAVLGNVPLNWMIVGTGDFNGDGNADILWRDTNSGTVAIWFMNGTQLTSSALVGNVPTTWAIVGTGDFDGNGKRDILWRDSSGNVAMWLMNGANIAQSGVIGFVPSNWNVNLTGDFNGDLKSDILWRNSSGALAIWFMSGLNVASSSNVSGLVFDNTWQVQAANAE